MAGGMADGYAKGGSVKGAAKIGKVMGEFKAGELHSGSKSGPKVTNPKQATAIAMSEARKAGAKMPMKKAGGGSVNRMPPIGGSVNRMPPIGDSVASGNRMSEMEAKEMREMMRRAPGAGAMSEREMRQVKKRVPVAPRLPLIGDSVASGNRMSLMDAADRAAVLRTTPRAKGGAMAKKGGGLAAMPKGGKSC
jgi:hypothetical protein